MFPTMINSIVINPIGAIQERIALLSKPAMLLADEAGAAPLSVELYTPQPLPSLPAAVQVAVYRIVTESFVNPIGRLIFPPAAGGNHG